MEVDNAWELSKENVQPLKSGRRMGDLQKALRSDPTSLQNEAQQFELQLRKVEDPHEKLDVWYNYIGWREQNYVGKNKDTIKLLQQCLRFYKEKTEFYQNEKYVGLWLRCTEILPESTCLFNFMYDNDIGTSLAAFYKSYAEHLELIGSTKRADELYCIGIQRNAEPVEILKEAKKGFEIRMMKRKAGQNVDDQIGDSTVRTRKVLGALKPMKSGKVGNDRVKNLSSSRAKTGSTSSTRNSSSSAFEIYGDSSNVSSGVLPSGTGQMKDIPLGDAVDSENTKKMQILKGTKLRNAGGSVSSATQFEIFHEESQPVDPLSSETPKQVVVSSRKPLSSKKREEQEDPFYTKTEESNQNAVYKYCKHLIYMGAREISFEELKAQLPKYSDPDQQSQKEANQVVQPLVQNEEVPAKKSNDIEMQSPHKTPNNIEKMLHELGGDDKTYPSESTGYVGSRKQTKLDFGFGLDVSCIGPTDDLINHITENLGCIPNSTNSDKIAKQLEELDMTQRFPLKPSSKQKGNIDSNPTEMTHNDDLTRQLAELDMTQRISQHPSDKHRESPNQDPSRLINNGDVTRQLAELNMTQRLSQHPPDKQRESSHINASRMENDMARQLEELDMTQKGFGIFGNNQMENKSINFNQSAVEDKNDLSKNLDFDMTHNGIDIFNDPTAALKRLNQNEGFGIFEDEPKSNVKSTNLGFEIFADNPIGGQKKPNNTSDKGFAIFSDEQMDVPKKPNSTSNKGFEIFLDNETDQPKKPNDTSSRGHDVFGNSSVIASKNTNDESFSQGFDIFNDPTAALKRLNQNEEFGIFEDDTTSKVGNKKAGYEIFTDNQMNAPKNTDSSFNHGFDIFNDPTAALKRLNQSESTGFGIFEDETKAKSLPKTGFGIFQDSESKANQNRSDSQEGSNLYTSTSQKPGYDMFSDTHLATFNRPDNSFNKDLSMFQEDSTTKMAMAHLKRPASTPAAPRTYIGHVTFGTNISAFNNPDLSIIEELSGESDRAAADSGHTPPDNVFSTDQSTNQGTPPNQINYLNPFDSPVKSRLVESVMSHITSTDGFLYINGPLPHVNKQTVDICLGPRRIHITKAINRERDGLSTYRARYAGTNKSLVLKVVDQSIIDSKSNLWDFYISRTIHERLQGADAVPEYHNMFMKINYVSVYSDALCFESPFYNTGTLKDLIKLYKKHSQQMEESLVMLYSYDILHSVHILHQLNILHCNLHPAKFLLGDRERIEDGPLSIIALTMTGFKNSVDMTLLPSDTKLFGGNQTDSFESLAMKNGEPWGPEVDYYAAAAVIHEMVFQNPMNTFYDNNKKTMRICNIIPSGWNEQLWSCLFSSLINGAEEIETLLQVLQQQLTNPTCVAKLDAAIQRKEDLLMDDD